MKSRSLAHIAYLITITFKGIDGLIETFLGLVIAFAGPEKLYLFIMRVTTPELGENPTNRFAAAIQHGAAGMAHASTRFIVFFLLVHGVLKTGIVANLLLNQRWIFPFACAILTAFVVYMGHHLSVHWSWWTFAFALFDLFTVALIVNEWVNPARPAAR
jgi:uncharacterized membrane protein